MVVRASISQQTQRPNGGTLPAAARTRHPSTPEGNEQINIIGCGTKTTRAAAHLVAKHCGFLSANRFAVTVLRICLKAAGMPALPGALPAELQKLEKAQRSLAQGGGTVYSSS